MMEQLKQMHRRIEAQIADGASPGCAYIALRRGEIIAQGSVGYFSDQRSPHVTLTTPYDLASISKLYMTFALLNLHEAGAVNLEDRCSLYLPSFHESTLTIIDLLTHRAGFQISLADLRNRSGDEFPELLFNTTPPPKRAGKIIYENIGFVMLKRVVEVVTTIKCEDFLDHLLDEFELRETYVCRGESPCVINTPPSEVVDGTVIQGVTHDETARLLGGFGGNAGIFATVSDLSAFAQIWLDPVGRLTSSTLGKFVFRDYDDSGTSPQALGWWKRVPGWNRYHPDLYSHTGFTGGLLAIDIRTSTSIAFLCNRTFLGRQNIKHRQIWYELLDSLL